MSLKSLSALSILLLGTAAASAQNVTSGEAGLSTMGVYVAPSFELDSKSAVRIPVYLGSATRDLTSDSNSYSTKIDLTSGGVVYDYAPWSNGLFVSGGVMLGGFNFKASTTSITTGTATYAGAFDVELKQKSAVAPVVSAGYRYVSRGGFSAGFELGGKFTKYDVTVSGTGYDGLSAVQKQDVDSELQDTTKAIRDLSVIPFATLSVGFKF